MHGSADEHTHIYFVLLIHVIVFILLKQKNGDLSSSSRFQSEYILQNHLPQSFTG
jgi:hypothetical protein